MTDVDPIPQEAIDCLGRFLFESAQEVTTWDNCKPEYRGQYRELALQGLDALVRDRHMVTAADVEGWKAVARAKTSMIDAATERAERAEAKLEAARTTCERILRVVGGPEALRIVHAHARAFLSVHQEPRDE